MKSNPWLSISGETVGIVKRLLSNLSIKVRTEQYNFFESIIHPTMYTKILDVGATSDETLKDSNMFEKLYPNPHNLTAATIEDVNILQKLYPRIKTIKITPHSLLPFRDAQFDVAVSWATLEHVGNYEDQKFFLKELMRVAKKIYLTTPYRGCIYEPHTGFFFLHWLPLPIFRKICKITGRKPWSFEQILNPLFVKDIYHLYPNSVLRVKIFRMFGFLPSHLIITSQKKK